LIEFGDGAGGQLRDNIDGPKSTSARASTAPWPVAATSNAPVPESKLLNMFGSS